jgi:hypothetical protein
MASPNNEEIASIFESANSTVILADVSADFALTEKVAKTAKAKGLFAVIGLVNGNEEQASVLADISGSAIILPSGGDACVYHFASTVISPMNIIGLIGIDWTDVKNSLQDSGLGYFSYGNGNDIDSIVGDCPANFSEVCKLDIMKNVLINIETINDLGMYFIDGVVERTCEKLHDDASLCFSAQILDDSHKVSVMGMIVATGK